MNCCTSDPSELTPHTPQTPDLRPQTPDLRPQTSDLRPQTSDPRPETSELGKSLFCVLCSCQLAIFIAFPSPESSQLNNKESWQAWPGVSSSGPQPSPQMKF